MKKIGKLAINAEKVIKNEELVNLRGGSYPPDEGCTYCECWDGSYLLGDYCIAPGADAYTVCRDVHPDSNHVTCMTYASQCGC